MSRDLWQNRRALQLNQQMVKLYAGADLQKGIEKLVKAFQDQTGIVVIPDYGGAIASGQIDGVSVVDVLMGSQKRKITKRTHLLK